MLSGIMLSGIMLSGIMLCGIMLSGIMLSDILLSGIMLSGIMVNVEAPKMLGPQAKAACLLLKERVAFSNSARFTSIRFDSKYDGERGERRRADG
jgi:hypothetical protein